MIPFYYISSGIDSSELCSPSKDPSFLKAKHIINFLFSPSLPTSIQRNLYFFYVQYTIALACIWMCYVHTCTSAQKHRHTYIVASLMVVLVRIRYSQENGVHFSIKSLIDMKTPISFIYRIVDVNVVVKKKKRLDSIFGKHIPTCITTWPLSLV